MGRRREQDSSISRSLFERQTMQRQHVDTAEHKNGRSTLRLFLPYRSSSLKVQVPTVQKLFGYLFSPAKFDSSMLAYPSSAWRQYKCFHMCHGDVWHGRAAFAAWFAKVPPLPPVALMSLVRVECSRWSVAFPCIFSPFFKGSASGCCGVLGTESEFFRRWIE